MNGAFQLTPQAIDDIDEIWWRIAQDKPDAANNVERQIVATCRRLASHPLMGAVRHDLTDREVRFMTVPRYPNYVIIYRPDTVPLQVIAVLHGMRDLKTVLDTRT